MVGEKIQPSEVTLRAYRIHDVCAAPLRDFFILQAKQVNQQGHDHRGDNGVQPDG